MDLQAEKIELAKRLLETDNEELLQQVKNIFDSHNMIPQFVIEGIEKSRKQADEGLLTSDEEVMKKYIRYL